MKALLKWLGRVALRLLGVAVIAAIAGFIYQTIAEASDAQRHPPPGQRVDVGGYALHIYCSGPTNTGNPTVVLEAGLGATTAAWAWVQPEIARTTRVCAYDRAGMGGSDPGLEPHDARHIAQALHQLLQNANVAGPYVLVGWSFGGLYIRAYADQYPSEVAGLVLIDSSHPDQCTSTPAGQAQCNASAQIFSVAPVLARLGVMRLMSQFQPDSGLPEPQNTQLKLTLATTQAWEAQRAEFLASPVSNAQVRAAKPLMDLPLMVVTATEHGTTPELEQGWQTWQRELAALSTNSTHHVVAGTSHTSLVYDQKDAQASIAAILHIVETARVGNH